MTATEYNGWTNWETWNTALWMGNDPGTEPESRRIVTEAVAGRGEDGYYDGGQALKDWWTDLMDPEESGGAALPGPIQDAWNATLGAVNWREIAEHLDDEEDDDD